MNQYKQPWSFSDNSLQRSFLWSLAITVLPVIASFIVSWVVARWAGSGILGTVSWVMAFATACLIVGKFGVEVAASRLASEFGVSNPGRLRALFSAGLRLRAAFTLPVALGAFLFAAQLASFFNDASLVRPIQAGAFVIACASFYEFSEHFLVGLNRLSTVYTLRAIYQLARVVLTVAIVGAGLGAASILTGYCAAWCIGIAAYCILLFRYLPPSEGAGGDSFIAKRLFLLSIPLAISGASVAIYSQMDKIMLGYFCTMEEVGQYTVGRNVVEVSLFPVFALIMTLRPALASRFARGAKEECSAIVKRTLFVSLISGVLFGSIFSVFGTSLVVYVFSDTFSDAGTLMGIFLWIIVLRSLGAVILPALIAAEKASIYAYLTLFSAAGNFVLNLILIPAYQARGAIAATLISYGFLLILGLYFVLKTFTIHMSASNLFLSLRVVLAGVATSVLFGEIFPNHPPQASVLLLSLLLVVIYALCLLTLRVVPLKELKNVTNPFRE
jgi:O-antigen/teichoic acid export membrane protein